MQPAPRSARLDAELLLGYAVGVDRTAIVAHPEAPVGADAAARFEVSIARRDKGEPVAYIRGMKEFFGLAFAVDDRALIPRPETEALVEAAEAEVMRRLTAGARPIGSPPIRIADVGTGSGAVAVALVAALRRRRAARRGPGPRDGHLARRTRSRARERRRARASPTRSGSSRPTSCRPVVEPFDLILANLPYVRSDAMPGLPVATSFEPALALDGGPDGLEVIGRLLDRLPDGLADDGVAFLEIGADQGAADRGPSWRRHCPGGAVRSSRTWPGCRGSHASVARVRSSSGRA